MSEKIKAALGNKQGVTIMLSLCLMAFFTLLGAAVMITAASYAADTQQTYLKDQTYVTAKTMSSVIGNELKNPDSELGQYLFCEFDGTRTIDNTGTEPQIVTVSGGTSDEYWRTKNMNEDNPVEDVRNISVSAQIGAGELPEGADIGESGKISVTASKVREKGSDEPVMYISVKAAKAQQMYVIKTCWQPPDSADGEYDGWMIVYSSAADYNESGDGGSE